MLAKTYPWLPVTPLPRAPVTSKAPGLLELSLLTLAWALLAFQVARVAVPLLVLEAAQQHAATGGVTPGSPPDTVHPPDHYMTWKGEHQKGISCITYVF